jgi:hypothetical protein
MKRAIAFTLCLASACASEHGATGAEDAFVDTPRGADGATAGEPEDGAASVAAEPARSMEGESAGGDAGIASGTPGVGSCRLTPITCAADTVDARGTTPWGELHIEQIGVSYWAGFTSGTSVFARGDVGGAPIELYVSPVPDTLSSEPAAPPGEYEVLADDALGQRLLARFNDCAGSTELAAHLRIERNDGPPQGLLSEWPGKPVRFEGVLTISQPGWELSLPLSISKICDAWVDV